MTTKPRKPANPKVADPKQLAQVAANWSDEFLECREVGHAPKLWRFEKKGRNYLRTIFCTRCKRNRWTLLTPRGAILADQTRYEPGYLTKGLGRIDADGKMVLRVEQMRRSGLKV